MADATKRLATDGTLDKLNNTTTGIPGINSKLTSIDNDLKDSANGLGGVNTKLTTVNSTLSNTTTGIPGINSKLTSIDNDLKSNGPLDSALKAIGTAIGNLPNATQEAADNANAAAEEARAAKESIAGTLSNIINSNSYDFLFLEPKKNETKSGITFEWNGDKCSINGTASAQVFNNIFGSSTSFPEGMVPGGTYFVEFSSENVEFEILQMNSDGGIVGYIVGKNTGYNKWFTIPEETSGLVIRLLIRNGKTVDEVVSPKILATFSNSILTNILLENSTLIQNDIPKDSDLNLVETGWWLMPSNRNYSNTPIPDYHYGTLLCIIEKNVTFQLLFEGGTGGTVYYRSWVNSNYTQWSAMSSQSSNNYTFNNYENTYNVTASPSISTDTNNYLGPTGDDTDVTSSIITMLTQSGVCRLGKGDYYVNDLAMPNGTMISGSGYSTRIILSGSSEGFAIKMGSHCIVENVRVVGSANDISTPTEVGNRHGIIWQGTYTEDQNAPQRSIVDNVFISDFTGGGITCYDTGYGTYNHLEVSNANIWLCGAGVNIPYWSEFHKFTNVRAGACYRGCVNNGGNNMFTNCDFSGNKVAFIMDNSSNQSPNNSHGSCVGCVFNHTDNNSGIGIEILNCDNGFMFDGCQVFYSQIYIDDSNGVVFNGCNFGFRNCDVTVKNGGTVLFANSMVENDIPISVTNNTHVHFSNCYNRESGEEWKLQ